MLTNLPEIAWIALSLSQTWHGCFQVRFGSKKENSPKRNIDYHKMGCFIFWQFFPLSVDQLINMNNGTTKHWFWRLQKVVVCFFQLKKNLVYKSPKKQQLLSEIGEIHGNISSHSRVTSLHGKTQVAVVESEVSSTTEAGVKPCPKTPNFEWMFRAVFWSLGEELFFSKKLA